MKKATIEDRVRSICSRWIYYLSPRISETDQARMRAEAARLWNWIDHQPEPEQLWQIMLDESTWMFADPNDSNSIAGTGAIGADWESMTIECESEAFAAAATRNGWR